MDSSGKTDAELNVITIKLKNNFKTTNFYGTERKINDDRKDDSIC